MNNTLLEEQLILFVKENPILYAETSSRAAYIRMNREKLWRTFADENNLDWQRVRTMWQDIRGRYCSLRKTDETHKFKHSHLLGFLDDINKKEDGYS